MLVFMRDDTHCLLSSKTVTFHDWFECLSKGLLQDKLATQLSKAQKLSLALHSQNA